MIVVPVILAGGIGERFWPFSRAKMPKQLLPIISNKSMIEETFLRVSGFSSKGVKPLLVTGNLISSKIKKVVPKKIAYDVITEPIGKNTAPAVAIAAAFVEKKYGSDAVMVVLSADHAISPKQSFTKSVKYAATIASKEDSLVVFGIRPSRPDTGYGYIQQQKIFEESENGSSYVVKKFVEKPTAVKAKKYLETGKYLWNSGMFVWRTDVILNEFKNSMPDTYKKVITVKKKGFTKDAINKFYNTCEKESIDYGIMEKAKSVIAVAAEFNWDDIGSWEALSRVRETNKKGTAIHGKRIYESGCKDTIIANNSNLTVAVAGVDNLVVVTVNDAVLVISRDELPNIKKHLANLKESPKFPSKLF